MDRIDGALECQNVRLFVKGTRLRATDPDDLSERAENVVLGLENTGWMDFGTYSKIDTSAETESHVGAMLVEDLEWYLAQIGELND